MFFLSLIKALFLQEVLGLARIRHPEGDSDAVEGVVHHHAVRLVVDLHHADDGRDHLLADPQTAVLLLDALAPRSSVEGLELLQRRSLPLEGGVTLTRHRRQVLRPTDSEPKLITNETSTPLPVTTLLHTLDPATSKHVYIYLTNNVENHFP